MRRSGGHVGVRGGEGRETGKCGRGIGMIESMRRGVGQGEEEKGREGNAEVRKEERKQG